MDDEALEAADIDLIDLPEVDRDEAPMSEEHLLSSSDGILLVRTMPFELLRAEGGDGLSLVGYAAVFNAPARIDSWEGTFDEVIAPGAFAKSLREKKPVLMFNHGRHPTIGDMPIGVITKIREDSIGLHVEARLHNNWLIQPVRDAIADGSVTGMSFRFAPVKETWDHKRKPVPLRTITELRTPELGPVVFPAYTKTSVSVRSQEIALALTDPEVRAETARILLGTPVDEAAEDGTSSERAASTDEPAPVHSTGPTLAQRQARLRQIALKERAS